MPSSFTAGDIVAKEPFFVKLTCPSFGDGVLFRNNKLAMDTVCVVKVSCIAKLKCGVNEDIIDRLEDGFSTKSERLVIVFPLSTERNFADIAVVMDERKLLVNVSPRGELNCRWLDGCVGDVKDELAKKPL